LFIRKAAFAKQNATFIRCNDAFVLLKASLIVDGAAFVVQSDALLDQNDAFPIQNASFCIKKEAFAFLDAPNDGFPRAGLPRKRTYDPNGSVEAAIIVPLTLLIANGAISSDEIDTRSAFLSSDVRMAFARAGQGLRGDGEARRAAFVARC
jgi:hypothetical protein